MDGVAKTKAIKVRHPLELLTTLNGMVLSMLVGGFGWAVFSTLFGSGGILGYGHSVLQPAIEVYASHRLWTSMADGPFDHPWRPVWAAVLAGIALLSLARIVTAGSAMREDLEGVV